MKRSNTIVRTGVFMTLFLMLSAFAKADTDYTFVFTTEYSSVPCIYAGSPNYFKLEVKNTGGTDAQNVVAELFIDEERIWNETIASVPAGQEVSLDAVDYTIRPIMENTIWGDDHDTIAYKVVIREGDVVKKQQVFRYGVVYNGYLGKEYAYPYLDTTLRVFTFQGDVQVLVQEADKNMSAQETSREEDFAIALGGGSIHKALLYVSYNWDKTPDGDFKTWTTSFNDNTIAPIADYRDCGNLGRYARYGYGLVVYDVTDYVANGNNTFALEKSAGQVGVYPSSMIVLVENPSATSKAVYIVEEADMLSSQYNKNVDAVYPTSFEGITGDKAKLYVFAASAQAGEGDLIIDDTIHSDIWSGTSNSVEVYEQAFDPGDVSVKLKGTGSTLLALQQMVVVELTPTGLIKPTGTIDDAPWYGLDGRKLDGIPTQKGVYIRGNKKVVIL